MRRYFAATGLAVALVSGCGSPTGPTIVPAEGVVLLGGVPLSKARVRFLPLNDQTSTYSAQGVTDDQGRFTLTCRGRPGACTGESLVTVSEDEIPARLTTASARAELGAYLKALKNRPIPPTYTNAADSQLRVTVTPEQNEYRIELKR
jgi:hypothetical protein